MIPFGVYGPPSCDTPGFGSRAPKIGTDLYVEWERKKTCFPRYRGMPMKQLFKVPVNDSKDLYWLATAINIGSSL